MDVHPPARDGQIDQLRGSVRAQLKRLDVSQAIKDVLMEFQQRGQVLSADQALDVLQGRGLVDQLVRSLAPPPAALTAALQQSNVAAAIQQPFDYTQQSGIRPPLNRQRPFLHVRILAGRAFTEYAARSAAPGEQLTLHLALFGQRFAVQPVAANAEPAFAGDAYFDLPFGSNSSGSSSSYASGPGQLTSAAAAAAKSVRTVATDGSGLVGPLQLLPLNQALHLVVVQSTPGDGVEASAASSGALPSSTSLPDVAMAPQLCSHRAVAALGSGEWRAVLARRGRVTINVQLGLGPGAQDSLGVPAMSVAAGIVSLQLELQPPFHAPLDESLLVSQQRAEHARESDQLSSFIATAKAWWGEYVRQELSFRARPVKVLATAEDGSQYPVCSFVRPLQLGPTLGTAREVARWVSLLQHREDVALLPAGSSGAGQSAECWCSLHTVLSSGMASKEEMAVLLCSLLLGFGLDAWVVVGRLLDGSGHIWVCTRGAHALPTFWEPATGTRYSLGDANVWPYLSIGSVFNHQRLYANCQSNDLPASTSFALEEGRLWRQLDMGATAVPAPRWSPLMLQIQPAVDVHALAAHLEVRLRQQIADHRTTLGLPTTYWDEGLSHLLTPALVAYEWEAVSGEQASGNEEFQHGIKRAVPVGWVFKGVPQHHRSLAPGRMALALLQEPQAHDICCTTADEAPFALRVRVTAYPERLFSVWLMLAVKFRSSAPTS